MEDPIVLFIKGVYKSDILFSPDEEIFDEITSPYDEIPIKFTGLEHWITRTNVLCGHCGLSHNNVPIFLCDYFSNTTEITIGRLLFCTFPCYMSYIKKNYTGTKYDNMVFVIKYIYHIFTGEDIAEIPLAPDPWEIDAFGGKNARFTIFQFQKHVNKLIPQSKYLL